MLATQIFAVADASGEAFVSLYGDGGFAFIDVDGAMTLYTYEWKNNMPFYPHEDRRRFIDFHGGYSAPVFIQRSYQLTPEGEIAVALETELSAENGCNGVTFQLNLIKQRTALICLFSDGIEQVDKMTTVEAVQGLTAFKNLSGEFVKRRLIRFDHNSKKNGSGPVDDLAMAVIAVDHEQETVDAPSD
jgi:hypothetical protein